MSKLLIVDDEFRIRELIKNTPNMKVMRSMKPKTANRRS